jgi:hypothetical protein
VDDALTVRSSLNGHPLIKRTAVALVEGAIEKHKFFGLPLPEADAAEEAMHAKR